MPANRAKGAQVSGSAGKAGRSLKLVSKISVVNTTEIPNCRIVPRVLAEDPVPSGGTTVRVGQTRSTSLPTSSAKCSWPRVQETTAYWLPSGWRTGSWCCARISWSAWAHACANLSAKTFFLPVSNWMQDKSTIWPRHVAGSKMRLLQLDCAHKSSERSNRSMQASICLSTS